MSTNLVNISILAIANPSSSLGLATIRKSLEIAQPSGLKALFIAFFALTLQTNLCGLQPLFVKKLSVKLSVFF